MKPSRFTEEQIIGILREQEAGAKTVGKCPEFFAHLVWAERRPTMAQAVMAPLICWSFSISMFK
jgi:hypothetical protein